MKTVNEMLNSPLKTSGITATLTGLCAALLLLAASAVGQAADPLPLPLWPEGAPLGNGQTETNTARITVHHPEYPNGTAIVICPGGGYGGLVTGAEGHGIARWLNGQGITGVVLEYRLPKGRYLVPLLDAQRAIRTTRAQSKAWNLKPNRIGIMGFSAGGHLAATAGTHFDAGDAAATDPIQRINCRPDFMILVYPVISMGTNTHGGSRANLLGVNPPPALVKLFSNELQITQRTPPAFLTHAKDDTVVTPDNSRNFLAALQAKGIPSQYLELPSGGHGLNGYKGPMWDSWQTNALKWMKQEKLTAEN
jgi:acetyl esterase/lipase